MISIFWAIAALCIIATSAFGQGVDPLIGTWKMNVDKSTFVGTTAPKSDTYTFSGEGKILIDTVEIVFANGETSKVVLRHIYDGMPHPTTGTPLYDSSTYTRIGNTINVVRSRAGKLVAVGQFVIVPGRTLTHTEEGIDLNNQLYHGVLVFDRQ